MARNKPLLTAQGLPCSEERFWGKGGGGLRLPGFLGLDSAPGKCKRRERSVRRNKTSGKSEGWGGGSCESLELKEKERFCCRT